MTKLSALFCITLAAQAQSPTINEVPTREFGQLRLQSAGSGATSSSPNLIEGRELNSPQGIAFDISVSPPILYIADTANHRVLAWKNPAGLTNGAPADKVIGQKDMFSNLPLGPGSSLSTGLYFPLSVAVDPTGNLLVLDSGNNRILRYPAPFRQPSGEQLTVDLVIGQRTVGSGRLLNEGDPVPSNKSLAFQPYNGGPILAASISLDRQGNLWVADPGNNRVLRFPGVISLPANTLEPTADIVLGQSTFTSGTLPSTDATLYPDGPRTNPNILAQPAGVTVDAAGRVYVTDNYARVLYFSPAAQFVPAARILGIPHKVAPNQVPAPYPNSESLGTVDRGSLNGIPVGVFTDGTYVYVCDTTANRIVRYDAPERWLTASATVPSPPLAAWYGQADATSGKRNRGQVESLANGFNNPVAAAFLGSDMWVVDSGNNRVLDLPASSALNYSSAVRVLGQLDFGYSSPNLVEGRELWIASGGFPGGDVVVDRTSSPPHLYIADTFNNRILGFLDARRVGTDSRSILNQTADLVIGQTDKFHTTINYPSGLVDVPSESGLNLPTGLAIDAAGNLLVADSGNGRVLRFPAPFGQSPGVQRANLVIGKGTFNAPPLTDAGVRNLNTPFGLALLSDGSLAVSDFFHNRVVIFRRPRGGDFSNGLIGSIVLGQPSFDQSTFGTGLASMHNPTHIAADSSDRLYLCDTTNNRMLVFTNVLQTTNGSTAAFQLPGLTQPSGVTVSLTSGEIWLANTNANVILRLPEFSSLLLNPNSVASQIFTNLPQSVALDSFDNLIVAEGLNRVTFFYAKLVQQHAASYNTLPLAPGQLAYLYRLGADFDLPTADGTAFNPWRAVLADYKLLVNGTPAPIFRINKTRIDFMVPINTPSSGLVDLLVQRDSTGEIVGTVTLNMSPANPGFFASNAAGSGQAAAVNQDGTVNSPSNCVGRGQIISFYLTGQGFVDNAPADGAPPTAALPTPVKPSVAVGTVASTDPKYADMIQYSGLGGFAGGWQLNIKVPDVVPPGPNTLIALTMYDRLSRIGPNNQGVVITFCVK